MSDPLARTRFTEAAAAAFRAAIADAGGIEVFAVGRLDVEGLVAEVEVHCRGNAQAVPALLRAPKPGEVVIHNHPSGLLQASGADLHLAGRYGDDGVGMVITDNAVARALWVVEPKRPQPRVRVEEARVRAFFEEDLPRVLPGWEARPGQADMALAVLRALQEGNKERPVVAALEAGTGTGKSLAYLVPAALWAEANEARVAVATYTITLQGQLAGSDLPLLHRAGLPIAWAVLQGRSNYLCRRRLAEAFAELQEASTEEDAPPEDAPDPEAQAIRQLAEWAAQAKRGSKADLGFPVPEEAWEQVRSDHDQTLRARCPHYGSCLYYEARRDAAQARLIVVNQHLLLADLLVKKETGGDGILPRFDRVIVDEAHHLEDAATSLLGSELRAQGVRRAIAPLLPRQRGRRPGALDRVVETARPLVAPELGDRMALLAQGLDARLQALRQAAPELLESLSFELGEPPPGGSTAPDASRGESEASLRVTPALRLEARWEDRIRPMLAQLREGLDAAARGLSELQELVAELPEDKVLARPQPFLDLVRARGRLAEQAGVVAQMEVEDPERVQWIGPASIRRGPAQALLASAPVEVGPALRERLFQSMEATVLTSATLTVHQRFDHLLGRLGLGDAPEGPTLQTAVFPSPFDYRRQALLCLPRDFPPPEDPRFMPWARRFVVEALRASQGGAFVLCTSHAMVQDLHAATRQALGEQLLLLRQGDGGQRHLLEHFRDRHDAVLFGTDSFWEGVSVAGRALRLVIIPRLPFRVPTEPVLQARTERLEALGLDPFRAYSLPQAVLRLRQGFGRLIRTAEDRGAVVVLDRRIHDRWYGKVFLASLPPAARAIGPSRAVLDQLRAFNSASTGATLRSPPEET